MIIVLSTPNVEPRGLPVVFSVVSLGDYPYSYGEFEESKAAPAVALLVAQVLQQNGYSVSWVDYRSPNFGSATVVEVDGTFWVETRGRLFSGAPLSPADQPVWVEEVDSTAERIGEIFLDATVLDRRFTKGNVPTGDVPRSEFWTRNVGTVELV